MATRTLKANYETKDDSTGHVHQVFCASKDQKEIYYQFEDEPEADPEPDAPAEAANPSPTLVAAAPVVVAGLPPTITAGPAASIKDVQFSSAPDKGEELPLEELGAARGSGHSGNLSKYSTGLMSRAIGGKMPGGFNISSAKSHPPSPQRAHCRPRTRLSAASSATCYRPSSSLSAECSLPPIVDDCRSS